MPSFNELKKNKGDRLNKLKDKIEKMNSSGYSDPDEAKFWSPTKDSAGTAYAKIRFLPGTEGDEFPWVEIWSHGFQNSNTGQWYIEKSLTTLGKDDPVSDYNSKLWNSGSEENKNIARAQKRKRRYNSNILVIDDKGNPENNGKVFLFSYGKKIFDMLNEAMSPEFDDAEQFDPFDPWGGADFNLRVRKVEGYPNYDKSSFSETSELFDGDDERIKEIFDQQHSLSELVDPSKFKTYEELQARLDRVLGQRSARESEASVDSDLDLTKEAPAEKTRVSPKQEEKVIDSDDDLDFFKDLANDV